jgi:hypothetical protein
MGSDHILEVPMSGYFKVSTVLFCLLAFACSGPTMEMTTDSGAPQQEASVQTDAGADRADAGDPRIMVNCDVIDENTLAFSSGIQLTVIDATSKRQQATTDANGKATFASITPPYDVLVPSADGKGAPRVYAGLADPSVRLNTSSTTSTASQNSATLNMTIVGPPCGDNYCPYTLSTVSKDTGNGGRGSSGAAGSYWAGNPILSSPTTHQWFGPTKSVIIYWHVMVSDNSYTKFWHASGSTSVNAGDTVNLGTIYPSVIPTLGNLTSTITWVKEPTQWTTSQDVFFNYANGEGFAYLARVDSTVLTSGIPSVLGATVTVGGYGRPNDNKIYDGAYATTVPLPLTTTSAALTMTHPPDLTTPTPGGHVSSTGTIQWQDYGAPGLHYVGLSNPMTVLVVRTAANSLDLARMKALGVKLDPGNYYIDVGSQRPFTSMSDYVAPSNPNGPRSITFSEGSSIEKTFVMDP